MYIKYHFQYIHLHHPQFDSIFWPLQFPDGELSSSISNSNPEVSRMFNINSKRVQPELRVNWQLHRVPTPGIPVCSHLPAIKFITQQQ